MSIYISFIFRKPPVSALHLKKKTVRQCFTSARPPHPSYLFNYFTESFLFLTATAPAAAPLASSNAIHNAMLLSSPVFAAFSAFASAFAQSFISILIAVLLYVSPEYRVREIRFVYLHFSFSCKCRRRHQSQHHHKS